MEHAQNFLEYEIDLNLIYPKPSRIQLKRQCRKRVKQDFNQDWWDHPLGRLQHVQLLSFRYN